MNHHHILQRVTVSLIWPSTAIPVMLGEGAVFCGLLSESFLSWIPAKRLLVMELTPAILKLRVFWVFFAYLTRLMHPKPSKFSTVTHFLSNFIKWLWLYFLFDCVFLYPLPNLLNNHLSHFFQCSLVVPQKNLTICLHLFKIFFRGVYIYFSSSSFFICEWLESVCDFFKIILYNHFCSNCTVACSPDIKDLFMIFIVNIEVQYIERSKRWSLRKIRTRNINTADLCWNNHWTGFMDNVMGLFIHMA